MYTSYLMIYAKKRKLKIFHLNGFSANFCCFIIGDLSPLLPEPVNCHIDVLRLIKGDYHTQKRCAINVQ